MNPYALWGEAMTVKEAVEKTDALFPNAIPFSKKASWLKELDMKILTEFLSCYNGFQKVTLPEEYSPDVKLLVSEPFSEIYIRYLCLQSDIVNSDIAAYKNSAALFNSSYLSFMNYFNRTHLMKSNSIKISGG